MPMQLINLDPALVPSNPWIHLHPTDNVVVARVQIPAGARLEFEGRSVRGLPDDFARPQDGRQAYR